MSRKVSQLSICLLLTFSGLSPAQEVFSYDFDTVFPGDLDFGGYAYSYAYAGQGTPDCSENIVNDDDATATHDISSGPSAFATADFSNWTLDPQGPCWTYSGWGLGIGHILGFGDGAGNATYAQQLSGDFDDYTLQFDAWVDGVAAAGISAALRIQFQTPDALGEPETTLAVGTDEEAAVLLLPLNSTPQTFSYSLDSLAVLEGDPATWQAADTLQIQVQIQPQGDELATGFDNNNVLRIDNLSFTLPTSTGACDFDSDGDCDSADVNALTAVVVAGTNDVSFDLNGDNLVDGVDVESWLALAGTENVDVTGGNAYLGADANLDGFVDVSDLNIWSGNKFSSSSDFTLGDFNSDGFVDVSDLNIWNSLKFNSSDSVSAVPEPSSALMLLITFVGLTFCRRR